MAYRLDELAARTGSELVGDPGTLIEGIGSLARAVPGQLAFLNSYRYCGQLKNTRASAIALRHKDRALCALPMLVCDDPYVAFARLSQIFWQRPHPAPGVHATAVVADGSRLGSNVSIGPGSMVAVGTTIGDDCVVGPGCMIGENCTLGEHCRLLANVVLEHDVSLGADVLIHPGAVIGADGFGFADDKGVWIKISQHGRVVVGDNVEIGANTTIDRGTIDDTVIEEGVKIDNQVQIAHNVRVGSHTAIAGCAGIAGSTTIGRHCRIGGAAGVAEHLTICDRVTIAAMTAVNISIDKAGFYASSAPVEPYRSWLRNSVRIKQLDQLSKRVQRLEKEVGGDGGKP